MILAAKRLTLLLVILGACNEPAEEPPVSTPIPCEPGASLVPDGRCITVGVPSDGCAMGFEPADGSCTPVLPADACAPGQMALPGEASCREVAPCTGDRWGEAPIAANTEHVDGNYTATDSDGSAARPWPTIQQAVAAAESGAVVAVAPGTYAEDVRIQGKAVQLWGRCPREVGIVGTGAELAALFILNGANDTVVRRIAISGPESGIALTGSENVTVEEVWIHDALVRGVDAEAALGATSMRVVGSLLENNHEIGVYAVGAQVEVQGSVVRDTQPGALALGRAIDAVRDPVGVRASVQLRGSLLERNIEASLRSNGSDLTVEGTVVRDTLVGASGLSRALTALAAAVDARSNVHVLGSVFERSAGAGLFALGSDLAVESTVVRDTFLDALGKYGRGIAVQDDAGARATLSARGSLVERSHEIGIFVGGSDATIEGCLVRDGIPNAEGRGGIGIDFQLGTGTIATTIIERSREAGVVSWGSTLGLDGSIVRDTTANDAGRFGDGLLVIAPDSPARLDVSAARIGTSARAAIANFGGEVTLVTTELVCQAFDLNGEGAFVFDDQGGVTCGCPTPDSGCKNESADLEPPAPL